MQPVLWARGTPGASEGLTIGIQWLTSVESLLCASPALTQRVPNILGSWRPWCLSNSPQRSLAKRNAEQVDSSHPPLWPLQANPGASPFRVDGVGLAKTSRGGRGGLPGGRTAQWATLPLSGGPGVRHQWPSRHTSGALSLPPQPDTSQSGQYKTSLFLIFYKKSCLLTDGGDRMCEACDTPCRGPWPGAAPGGTGGPAAAGGPRPFSDLGRGHGGERGGVGCAASPTLGLAQGS